MSAFSEGVRPTHGGRTGRAFTRLLVDRNGSAGVQQAVSIAALIAGLLLAVQGLGQLAEGTFSKTARSLGGQATTASTAASSDPAAAAATQSPVVAAARKAASQFGLCILAMLFSFFVVRWWYRRRLAKAEQAPQEEAALPQIDRDAAFEKRHEILRILSADVGILFDSRMTVKHLMSRRLSTVEPSASAECVRERMEQDKIRHLLVCRDDRRLLGVISDRDLHKRQAKTAADLMTARPFAVGPDDLVSPAITLLVRRRISCLPVVAGEELVGVLTTTDLMMALQCALHALQKVSTEIAAAHAQREQAQRGGSLREQLAAEEAVGV